MTKSNLPEAFKQMDLNVVIGMEEVTNVFIAQYETNLHSEKSRLQTLISGFSKELTALGKTIKAGVDTKGYTSHDKVLGIIVTVKGVTVDMDVSPPTAEIEIKVADDDKSHNYSDSFRKTFDHPIPKSLLTQTRKINTKLDAAREDLTVVLKGIGSISRKEREVRGRISKLKLEASGFAGLLEDPKMLKLIQL